MTDALRKKLDRIDRVFDIQKLESLTADEDYIQKYYLKNKIPYSIFHTRQNFVHMGISRNGKFREEDLLEHVRLVDRYIEEHKATAILELATGRGANSYWLAKEHPDKNFTGIDLSEGQISFARKVANKLANFKVDLGNFHSLDKFQDDSFDVVFVIEALCHSTTPEKVFAEVRRVLKPGGHFIVIDGYLGSKELSEDEKVAAKITEHGMAVTEFLKYEQFKQLAADAQFEVVEEEDLSLYVIPTMRRFEKLADAFFFLPRISRLVVKLLPLEFTYNSVSGTLMPILFERGVSKYWSTVFRNNK